MPRLLAQTAKAFSHAHATIGFMTTASDGWAEWDRYITVNGQPAYYLGNVCGTCSFLFERLPGANAGIEVGDLTARLAVGIEDASAELIETLGQLMPGTSYLIVLLRLQPQLVRPFGPSDYFSLEQVQNEGGVDPFWNLPHYPKVPYYRVASRSGVPISPAGPYAEAFDFIVPMYPESLLDDSRIAFYENELRNGRAPTAIALSLLDVKQPERAEISHWCLAHYVVDGHHKLAAAARTQQELTLLAFIAVDRGVSTQDQLDDFLASYSGSD